MDSPSRPTASLAPAIPPSKPYENVKNVPARAALLTPAFVQLLMVQLSFGLSFSAYFLFPKYLATQFGSDARTIGAAAATPMVAGVLASPAIGAALDRFGRRSLLLLGAWIGAITSLSMSAVTHVGLFLYAVRALQGIGFALVFNAAVALVADRSPRARLGHAMGLLGSASLVTNAIGPSLAELVAEAWGWKFVFIGTAVMSVLTVCIGLRLLDSERQTTASAPLSLRPKDRRLSWVAAVTGAAFGTLMTFTQPQALAMGADRVAGFFFGFTAAALLVRIGLGSFTDRVGRLRVARASLVFYGAVTVATSLIRPGLLELFGFGFGIAHGLLYPALAALVAERSHPSRRGRALTSLNAAFNAGCGLSLLGSGFLAENTGYGAVFVAVGLVTVISGLTLRLREPNPSELSAR